MAQDLEGIIKKTPQHGFFSKLRTHAGKLALAGLLGMSITYTAPLTVPVAAAAISQSTNPITNAQQRITTDTRIYAEDETTILDSVGKIKREYVPYWNINPNLIVAAIAAEDRSFRTNDNGIDINATWRAFVMNAWNCGTQPKECYKYLKKSRTKDPTIRRTIKSKFSPQGGSTIDIQTIKHLWYGGKSEGIAEKLSQYTDAVRLTNEFDKNKIMEFYWNQAPLPVGGRTGIQELSRYLFNTDQEHLSLLQALAEAATLKDPIKYNPHNKTEKTTPDFQRELKGRMRYILEAMPETFSAELAYAQQQLTDIQEAHKQDPQTVSAKAVAVYNTNYLKFKQAAAAFDKALPNLRKTLADPNQSISFSKQGISEAPKGTLAKMIEQELAQMKQETDLTPPPGSNVITIIKADMQRDLTYFVHRQLAIDSTKLEGYAAPTKKEDTPPALEPHHSYIGTVIDAQDCTFTIRIGEHTLPLTCEGTTIIAEADASHVRGFITTLNQKQVATFAKKHLTLETRVAVNVTSENELELTQHPYSMQAAAIIIEPDGAIVALTGNAYDHGQPFNHLSERLPPGSGYKRFVYEAALELGWTSTDILNNSPQHYIFAGSDKNLQNWEISTKEDEMVTERISTWKGYASSQNFATADLYARLFTKLDDEKFLELAHQYAFAPEDEESDKDYQKRMIDAGIRMENSFSTLRDITRFEIAKDRLRKQGLTDVELISYGTDFETIDSELEQKINTLPREAEKLQRHRNLTRINYLHLKEHPEDMLNQPEVSQETIEALFNEIDTVDLSTPYSFDVLKHHPTFRFKLAEAYVKDVARKHGLEPEEKFKNFTGPSIILGTLESTPADFAKSYLHVGKTHLIKRIDNANGKTIYTADIPEQGEWNLAEKKMLALGRAVSLYGTAANIMGKKEFNKETGDYTREHPYLAGKTGTTNDSKHVNWTGNFSTTEQPTLSDLGVCSAFVFDYRGRRGGPPKGMERGKLGIFGGSTAGKICYDVITTHYPHSTELEPEELRAVFVDPVTGFGISCDNEPTVQEPVCSTNGNYKIVGVAFEE